MLRPVGRPLADQRYGDCPPVAEIVCEYGWFKAPSGNWRAVVIESVAGLTVMDSERVAVEPAESVTWIVKVTVPAVVGVPEILRLLGSKLSPAGRLDPLATDQVYGAVPPLA